MVYALTVFLFIIECISANCFEQVFPQGWDKTYCLNYLDEFHEIHFFGDKTYKVVFSYYIYIYIVREDNLVGLVSKEVDFMKFVQIIQAVCLVPALRENLLKTVCWDAFNNKQKHSESINHCLHQNWFVLRWKRLG